MTLLMLPNHSEKRQARVIDDSSQRERERELRCFPSADQNASNDARKEKEFKSQFNSICVSLNRLGLSLGAI